MKKYVELTNEPKSQKKQTASESKPGLPKLGLSASELKRNFKRLEKFRYILDDPEIQKLKNIKRHNSTDTYKHSIRVAVIAAALAERIGEDPDSAMRAGLLHDYCLLDYNLKGKEKREAKKALNAGLFCFYHPKKAAENSKRFGLTDRELDAISTHMFPLGPLPKSKLGWIIRMADLEAGTDETFWGKRKKDNKKDNKEDNKNTENSCTSNSQSV